MGLRLLTYPLHVNQLTQKSLHSIFYKPFLRYCQFPTPVAMNNHLTNPEEHRAWRCENPTNPGSCLSPFFVPGFSVSPLFGETPKRANKPARQKNQPNPEEHRAWRCEDPTNPGSCLSLFSLPSFSTQPAFWAECRAGLKPALLAENPNFPPVPFFQKTHAGDWVLL